MALLPGYAKQRLVPVDNTNPNPAPLLVSDNVLIAVTLPTDWSLLGSKNDLRVVRSTDGGVSGTEIPRVIVNNGPFGAAASSQAALFNIQADIAAASYEVTYYLVGENAGAGAPPTGITTDTASRTEDFEDERFQQFMHGHDNGARDTARKHAGSYGYKLSGLGPSSFNDNIIYFYGTGFDVYWSTDTEPAQDSLAYYIDEGNTLGFTVIGNGNNAFGAGNHLTVGGLSNSLHAVTFTYFKNGSVDTGADAVWLDDLTVTGCPVVYCSAVDAKTYKGTLQTFSYAVPFGALTRQPFSYDLLAPDTDPCWEGYTRRLLDYLAPRVFVAQDDKTSLLHQTFSMVARELSACTESVTLTRTDDARGDGNFHVHLRFEPLLSVPLVERVDGSGAVLETYTVTGTDGRTVTVSGVTSPKAGDHLLVTYTYTHKGLEFAVREALLELNILTSTGEFLDEWGRWFGVGRLITGTYGSDTYGGGLYGVSGTEDDAHFSRRIIDRVLQTRNTKAAIIAAVKTVTGGSPYIVEWFDAANPVAWIFKVTGDPAWSGGESAAALSKHLIWGRTARFRSSTAMGGGAYVFDVWVPQGSGYSAAQLLEIVKQYKAAGTKAFIRFQGT